MDHLARSMANGLVVAEPMDRVTDRRGDDELVAVTAARDARFVPVWRANNLFSKEDRPGAVLLDAEQAAVAELADHQVIFLGAREGIRYYAINLTDDFDPAAYDAWGSFGDLRLLGIRLDDFDAALLAYARGMVYWHVRHRFCGVCGHATSVHKAGHLRVCEQCGNSHFPRTDPAVIVLAHAEDSCLLGRKPEWPAGRYSTIAGFVEPGETAEQAVLREVQEETGIDLDGVTYHSSQPWPFPSSIMLGFHAHASSREIERRDQELEDARWFSRDQIEQALAKTGPLRLPPRISIARRLIEDWFRRAI